MYCVYPPKTRAPRANCRAGLRIEADYSSDNAMHVYHILPVPIVRRLPLASATKILVQRL